MLAELAFPELGLVPAGIDRPCVPWRIDQPQQAPYERLVGFLMVFDEVVELPQGPSGENRR